MTGIGDFADAAFQFSMLPVIGKMNLSLKYHMQMLGYMDA